jgi:hypothetical protein
LLNLKLKIQMKINLLLGSLILAGAAFSSFASECPIREEASSSSAYERLTDQNFWEIDLSAPLNSEPAKVSTHRKDCGCNTRIQLGFDGNDRVLSPEANHPFHPGDHAGRSSVFVAATALMLASRALKSR